LPPPLPPPPPPAAAPSGKAQGAQAAQALTSAGAGIGDVAVAFPHVFDLRSEAGSAELGHSHSCN
jgi:hypothetical protein